MTETTTIQPELTLEEALATIDALENELMHSKANAAIDDLLRESGAKLASVVRPLLPAWDRSVDYLDRCRAAVQKLRAEDKTSFLFAPTVLFGFSPAESGDRLPAMELEELSYNELCLAFEGNTGC